MKSLTIIWIGLALLGCQQKGGQRLPILGETSIDEATGQVTYYTAPAFAFTNQTNEIITHQSIKGKVHVVDFFFTSCPTICPKLTNHLKRAQDRFQDEEKVGILSYSIDPRHDTPEKLSRYATAYNINNEKWWLFNCLWGCYFFKV